MIATQMSELREAAPSSRAMHQISRNGLRILIVNTHLPVFPGTGGHEFLNTTNLSRLSARTGLVSMVHRAEDLEKVTGFSEAGVDLYLWKSPHLDTAGKAPHSASWSRATPCFR